MSDPAHLIRLLIFAIVIFSFLRRIAKLRTADKAPTQPTRPSQYRKPAQGRKNDFRDVPPPPENPELG